MELPSHLSYGLFRLHINCNLQLPFPRRGEPSGHPTRSGVLEGRSDTDTGQMRNMINTSYQSRRNFSLSPILWNILEIRTSVNQRHSIIDLQWIEIYPAIVRPHYKYNLSTGHVILLPPTQQGGVGDPWERRTWKGQWKCWRVCFRRSVHLGSPHQ